MRSHRPLPPALAAHPFAVRDALARGVGRGRLAGDDLERPFRGIRAPVPSTPIEAYVPRLRPGDRFSHTSALALWGAPLPNRVGQDVHITMQNESFSPRREGPRARGVIGHTTQGDATTLLHGIPVSTPLTAFLESAPILAHDELVAVGDYFVLDPRVADPRLERPLLHLGVLRDAIHTARGRGVRRARDAANDVRPGVESPMESALRLLLLRHNILEPTCGYELLTERRRIGWFDLAWPQFRVIAEYDGDGHRTSTRQYERDIRRFDEALEAGWHVVRVRASGLLERPTETVARVKRALAAHGWAEPSRTPKR